VPCSASFHHYPSPRAALAEIHRVLAAGAASHSTTEPPISLVARVADRVLRLVDRGHVRLYRASELRAMLADAGFDVLAVDLLHGGGYAIVTARRL